MSSARSAIEAQLRKGFRGSHQAAGSLPRTRGPCSLLLPSQEFAVGLSVLLRGTVHEKLKWAFNLYDINKDGCITKEVG